MSTFSAAHYHRDKSQVAVIGRKKEYVRNASSQNKSAIQIVNQNVGKAVSNQIPTDNAVKIDQHSRSSMQ
ncbi:unnamed protein product, partial [Rotaria sordida]